MILFFDYDLTISDLCKFYSDCCPMTRPMEQLAPGTFSCHDGFYIVDKCPVNTVNTGLKEMCEGWSDSGRSFNIFP